MKHRLILNCLFAVPATLAATTGLSQSLEIGKAVTVIPATENETEGKISQLEPGSDIFQDGVVRTYKIGAAGLEFVDQTTLTVYPNSSVKLDRFVYNPDRSVAEIALSLAKGAFRIATSTPHKPDKYKLQTPQVTLGIRGSVIHVFSDEVSSIVQALHGAFEGCSNISGECRLVRANDLLNGAKFWSDGRVELGVFSPNVGVRSTGGAGSTGSSRKAVGPSSPAIRVSDPAVDLPMPSIAGPPIAAVINSLFARTENSPPRNPDATVCFVRGMRVLTPDGERKIEELTVGDQVLTQSAGPQKIRWVSKQIFSRGEGRAWSPGVAPIFIEEDAISANFPNSRLIVSPAHSIYIDGLLIPARLLVNGQTIRQVQYSGTEIEYLNIELESHEIIYVNGATVETYLPVGDRCREHWSNFSEYSRQYAGREHRHITPQFPSVQGGRQALFWSRTRSLLSPLVDKRTALDRVRDQIAWRAKHCRVWTETHEGRAKRRVRSMWPVATS